MIAIALHHRVSSGLRRISQDASLFPSLGKRKHLPLEYWNRRIRIVRARGSAVRRYRTESDVPPAAIYLDPQDPGSRTSGFHEQIKSSAIRVTTNLRVPDLLD